MPFVYLLAAKPYGTLYVGSTFELARRVWQHKTRAIPGFTAKYGVDRLVWFETHESLETALVRERVVACGTILSGARSIYRWEGELSEETEVVVLLKTDVSKWDALRAAVRAQHPYQVPELLALPVDRGLDLYLSWLSSEVVG